MEQSNKNFKIMGSMMAALLILSVAGTIYFWNRSRNLAIEKAKVEIQANSLLSGQSRDIDHMNKKIDAAQKENTSLHTQVDRLNETLDQKNDRLATLQANYTSAASALRNFRDSLQVERAGWEEQMQKIAHENSSYISRNTTLDQELTALQDKMQQMIPVDALTVDGFRVKAVKRNDKETAKAKKVHTLMVSFQVPPYFNLTGTEEVYLSLTNTEGHSLLTPLRTVTIATADAEKLIPVHAVKKVDFTQRPQRIGFQLNTSDAIKPGLYHAAVYTGNRYLGAVEFQFRDSFWFF